MHILALALVLLCVPVHAETRAPALDRAALDALVSATARTHCVPGAFVLVRTPRESYARAYGSSALHGGRPVTADDHVRIGSNTKTMTGTLILMLAEEGRIGLDDPIAKYRAGVPNGDRITISQLLRMRSGLPNYSEPLAFNVSLDRDPNRVWTPEELLAGPLARQPDFAPDAKYAYSNTNTALLGLLAEQLTGRRLHDLFRERLFAPLGLTHTALPPLESGALPEPHPRGYQFASNVEGLKPRSPARVAAMRAGQLPPKDWTDANPSWAWSAGAAHSTAGEMATWVEALARGRLLGAAMQRRRMASLMSTNPADPAAVQYGWALAKMGPVLGHTGELPGFNTFMGHDPVTGTTIVTWTNLNESPAGTLPAVDLAKRIIGLLYGGGLRVGAPSAQ